MKNGYLIGLCIGLGLVATSATADKWEFTNKGYGVPVQQSESIERASGLTLQVGGSSHAHTVYDNGERTSEWCSRFSATKTGTQVGGIGHCYEEF